MSVCIKDLRPPKRFVCEVSGLACGAGEKPIRVNLFALAMCRARSRFSRVGGMGAVETRVRTGPNSVSTDSMPSRELTRLKPWSGSGVRARRTRLFALTTSAAVAAACVTIGIERRSVCDETAEVERDEWCVGVDSVDGLSVPLLVCGRFGSFARLRAGMGLTSRLFCRSTPLL